MAHTLNYRKVDGGKLETYTVQTMYTRSGSHQPWAAPTENRNRGLEQVANARSILEAIRLTRAAAAQVGIEASASSVAARGAVALLSEQAKQKEDSLLAIAAVHALAGIAGKDADEVLVELLGIGNGSLRQHVAWTAARRPPSSPMLQALVRVLAGGGLAGMHAQATLARWAAVDSRAVAAALRAALQMDLTTAGRRNTVETLGLVPDPSVTGELSTIALNPGESDAVRAVAIAALGDRSGRLPTAVAWLARKQGPVTDAARLALADATLQRVRSQYDGLTVAQVHLGARLDRELRRAGMGDTGGVATLLVKLGSALADTPGMGRVLTIGRGTAQGALEEEQVGVDARQQFASVALADGEGTSFADHWPATIAAQRGIRRAFARHGRPAVLHLRMADVGTLAAAEVAASMGIPTVFSLAPDPHAVIAAREAAGSLDRRMFAAEDAKTQLWYRVALVERLTAQADEVVLFPRARQEEEMRDLVGIDLTGRGHRFTVVPEGIDVAHIRRSVTALRSAEPAETPLSPALSDLVARVAELPTTRHGLPIVLSVGRLNELKGMARLVEAFATDSDLRSRATLVVVGGDLDDPSAVEAEELARIRRVVADQPEVGDAIVLLGHRPNGEVADLLGAVRHGLGAMIGPGGAYACASRKEEFGLAIVEALAAGLPVVAPIVGGPATYVQDGTTGRLVDTTDPAALAHGIADALDMSSRPGRADQAADAIARRYDISVMARALTAVYRRAAARRVERLAS